MDSMTLPVEELPCLPSEIEQELADLARGVLPPKLNFAPLRKAAVDRALAELGFAPPRTSWVLDIRGFRVAFELSWDKANRAFCFARWWKADRFRRIVNRLYPVARFAR